MWAVVSLVSEQTFIRIKVNSCSCGADLVSGSDVGGLVAGLVALLECPHIASPLVADKLVTLLLTMLGSSYRQPGQSEAASRALKLAVLGAMCPHPLPPPPLYPWALPRPPLLSTTTTPPHMMSKATTWTQKSVNEFCICTCI